MPEPPVTYTDAICGETLTEGKDEILVLTIRRQDGSPNRQEIFVHRECLARLIEKRIPLGEVFEAH